MGENHPKVAQSNLPQSPTKHLVVSKSSKIAQYGTRLHPIHHLPNELISEVFMRGSQLNPAFGMTISHVSPFFREVAIATPSLWTHIVFRDSSSFDMAATYLERCGKAGLHVEIRWSSLENLDGLRAEEALQLLHPHVCHILRLEFWTWNHTVLKYLLRGLRGATATMLKTLMVHVMDRQAFVYDLSPGAEVFCARSTKLETMSVGVSTLLTLNPPLDEVRSMILKEDELSPADALVSTLKLVLRRSPQLRRLAIVANRRPGFGMGMGMGTAEETWRQLQSMPNASCHLTALRFSDCLLDGIVSTLRLISASTLTELTIDHSRLSNFRSYATHASMESFPSMPNLVSFSVRSLIFDTADMVQALGKMPKLRQLSLESCNLEKGLMVGLEKVCPLLDDLVLTSYVPPDQIQGLTPWRALQDMITKRIDTPDLSTIRKLKVREQFGEYEHIEAIDNLRRKVPKLTVV